jgi:hypothetical protein
MHQQLLVNMIHSFDHNNLALLVLVYMLEEISSDIVLNKLVLMHMYQLD